MAFPELVKKTASNQKLIVLILALLVLAIYGRTISFEYVFDDIPVLVENPTIKKGLSSMDVIWTKPYRYGLVGNENNLFRPLASTSFALDSTLFSQNPNASHLINILLYFICCLLFYHLCLNFFKDETLALIGGLIFLAHPLHVEVAANIKSRDEILCLIFILATLLLLPKKGKKSNGNMKFLPLFTFLLAAYSKESFIYLAGIIPLWNYTVIKHNLKSSILKSLPFLAPLALYMLHRFVALSGVDLIPSTLSFTDNVLMACETTSIWVLTNFAIIGEYFKLLIAPYPLVIDRGFATISPNDSLSVQNVFGIVLGVSILAGLVLSIFKKDKISIPLAFLLMFVLAFCNWFFLSGVTVADRMLFIPSVGFVLLICIGASKLFKIFSKKNSPILGILCVYILGLVFLSINRVPDWKSNFVLFTQDAQIAPNNYNLQLASGLAYGTQSLSDPLQRDNYLIKARTNFRKALDLVENGDKALSEYGVLMHSIGQTDSAIICFTKALEVNPSNQKAVNNLSILKYQSGDINGAITILKEHIDLNPISINALNTLAGIYINNQQPEEAYLAVKNQEEYLSDHLIYYELLRMTCERYEGCDEMGYIERKVRKLK